MVECTRHPKAALSTIVIGLAVCFYAAQAPGQGPRGSAHDFSSAEWSGGRFCTICHTTKAGWNRKLSTQNYTLYSSATLDAADMGQPRETSARCLSCHDGTVAVDSFGGKTGTTFISPSKRIGPDLSSHHPVSFTYDSALATRDGGLYDPAATSSGLGGTIAADMLGEGSTLECNACHDPHERGEFSDFLVMPVGGAALCHTCHDQQPTVGRHHIPGRDDPWGVARGTDFNCTMCHGDDLGGEMGPACTSCHGDFSPPDPPPSGHHFGDRTDPLKNCDVCHGDDLDGGDREPSCFTCHGSIWLEEPSPNVAAVAGPGDAEIGGDSLQSDGSGAADTDAAGDTNGTIFSYDWIFAGADTWTVSVSSNAQLRVTFQEFSGFLMVTTIHANGQITTGVGIEFAGFIVWVDDARSIFLGNIDRNAGRMSGIALDRDGNNSIWSAEKR